MIETHHTAPKQLSLSERDIQTSHATELGELRAQQAEQIEAERIADLIAVQSRGQVESVNSQAYPSYGSEGINEKNATDFIQRGKSPDDHPLAELHSLDRRRLAATKGLARVAVNGATPGLEVPAHQHSAVA